MIFYVLFFSRHFRPHYAGFLHMRLYVRYSADIAYFLLHIRPSQFCIMQIFRICVDKLIFSSISGRRHRNTYRVFIKYCVFPLKFWIFLNSASSAAALVFYLPGVCTHTDTEG